MKSSGHTKSKYRVMSRSEPFFSPAGIVASLPLSFIQGHHAGNLPILTFSLLLQLSHYQTAMLWLLPVWKTIRLNTASTSNQLLSMRKKKKILGKKMVCVYNFHFLFNLFVPPCGFCLQNTSAV